MWCSRYVSDLGGKSTWGTERLASTSLWPRQFTLVGYSRTRCIPRRYSWRMAVWCIAVGDVRSTCLWCLRVLPTSSMGWAWKPSTLSWVPTSSLNIYRHCFSLCRRPMFFHVYHGDGRKSVPLEQTEEASGYLRVCQKQPSAMMVAAKMEDYQLLGEDLDKGLKELGYSREDVSLELFSSEKPHVFDPHFSKEKKCSYTFYSPSLGMAYGNPSISELGKVLTKVALERSCLVLCSPDRGPPGGSEYWCTLLGKLTLTSVQLADDAI